MKSSLDHAHEHHAQICRAARIARETRARCDDRDTFRSGRPASTEPGAHPFDAFHPPATTRPAVPEGSMRLFGRDEQAMAAAWARSIVAPCLGQRRTNARQHVRGHQVMPPTLPALFPGLSHTQYSADGRFIWAALSSSCRTGNQLHDLLSGTTQTLEVDGQPLGETYEGRFSADGTHFYAYSRLGCHVFDVRGLRPTLVRSVSISRPLEREVAAEPSTPKEWREGETLTLDFTLEPVGGGYGEFPRMLVGFDATKAYVALTSRAGAALFELSGHTTPIDEIIASNHTDDLVTMSATEVIWWRFEQGVAAPTPLPGLSSSVAPGGLILDDRTLLLAGAGGSDDASGPAGGLWRLESGRWTASPLPVEALRLSESDDGEFIAILGENETTFLRRTPSGCEPVGAAPHPEGSNSLDRLWNCTFGTRNPRLFRVGHNQPWVWIGDGGVDLLDLPGLGKLTRGRPTLSDDEQRAYLIVDGKPWGWDLSGSAILPVDLPRLPDAFRASDILAQNQRVLVLNEDGTQAWHWRQGSQEGPLLLTFPQPVQHLSEHAISPDGKLLAFVADNAAYLLDLADPTAAPLCLRDADQKSTSTVSIVADGTIALVTGTNHSGYAERHFDLAAGVVEPRAKL